MTPSRIFLMLCAAAASCRDGPRSTTAAYTWDAMDGATTVSLAAWGKDSVALRMAVEHVRAAMQPARANASPPL